METSQLSGFGVSLSETQRLLSGTTTNPEDSYKEESIKKHRNKSLDPQWQKLDQSASKDKTSDI